VPIARRLGAFSLACGAALALAACPNTGNPPRPSTAEASPSASAAGSAEVVADAAVASPTDAASDAPAESTVAEAPLEGANFIAQAKAIFRVAACGGNDPVPPQIDAALVEEHCSELKQLYAQFKTTWMDVAMPFIDKLRPKDLPTQVVYPFGGGDLLTALATYPDAAELTIMSLEVAGDPRGIDNVKTAQLKPALQLLRLHLGKLFDKVHSRTVNLELQSQAVLPGEATFSMAALAIHGYVPYAVRYFRFEPDGTIKYFTADDIEKADKAVKGNAGGQGNSAKRIFDNIEIMFRKPGGPIKTARHIAWNLDDEHFKGTPLHKHLLSKGRFAAMTKAASHLLWADNFSTIRDLLLSQMEWMISDTTCPPPRYAKKAGFTQDTYGQYEWAEPFGPVNNRDIEAFKKLFKENPQRALPFRYGYPDNKSHGHMVITHK
jgi:hypothetical protein